MTRDRGRDENRDEAGQDGDAEGGQAQRPAPAAGGGISIGTMTGGAAASGPGAVAEDRTQRVGPQPGEPPVAGGPVPVPAPPGAGGIGVGVMTGGAVAAGEEARAVDASARLVAVSPELLTAVRVLRGQLPLLAPAADGRLAVVDAELAEIEGESERNDGQVERGRLERLRELLVGGGTAASGLASAIAVAEAIGKLLG